MNTCVFDRHHLLIMPAKVVGKRPLVHALFRSYKWFSEGSTVLMKGDSIMLMVIV